jgi:thiamine-phosphate pyrophosphorylase
LPRQSALKLRPDYVAFGPIFATSSKVGTDPALGLQQLQHAGELARRADIPLVAIGGLTLSVAADVGGAGALGAVISDLLAEGSAGERIAERARAWQSALGAT